LASVLSGTSDIYDLIYGPFVAGGSDRAIAERKSLSFVFLADRTKGRAYAEAAEHKSTVFLPSSSSS